ncbi:hypothetical protein pdam_00001262, partial [Pocillopora damicornis]
ESIEEITKPMNDQWYRRNNEQFVSLNQEGPIFAQLKIHSILSRSQNAARKYEEICILESSTGGTAVAVNKRDDTIFVKTLSTPLRSLNNLDKVKRLYPEILFKKVPREVGSDYFYFQSNLKDKRRVLGFDKYGLPMNTGQVTPNSEESLFTRG